MSTADWQNSEDMLVTQIIHHIARKHECNVDIDYDNHTIDFENCDDKKGEIARDIEEHFNVY